MEAGRFVGQLVQLAVYFSAIAAAAVAVAAAAASSPTFVGDICKIKDGSIGVCRNITFCPEARDALRKGESPTVCSYSGFTPIVCCPADRVSTRKCVKYGEAVYRYEKSFLVNQAKVQVDQCATKGLPFVVGGQKAIAKEFPHMALLGYGENTKEPTWSCGGSLISERFVLTAAHCFFTSGGSPKVVRLGELNLKTVNEGKHEDFIVAENIPHPDYKNEGYYNDVGLIRLERDVTFTASIRPACLHSIKEIADKDVIATGWGYTDWATYETSDHLMKLNMPILKSDECHTLFRSLVGLQKGVEEDTMICAGYHNSNKDTCKGDSGGPVQLKLRNPYCMYSVVGITSFGKGQCGNTPAIYTRVFQYLPWIESIVWTNNK